MGKDKNKTPFSERVMWYGAIFGGISLLGSAIPAVPWRYARVDTNVGNRFCVDRSYTLFGAGDQFGKRVGWFSIHKKMKRKAEEFGRPSPLTALLGTVTGVLGAGGAALGCGTWQICKDHVNARALAYNTVAISGLASFILLLLGCFAGVATTLCMTMEDGDKKKKKKKKSDSLSPKGRTMTAAIFAFILPCAGVLTFLFSLDVALKDLKNTAYYPYAASHAGAYVGGVGCFINWIVMMIAINRVTPLFGKKKSDDDDEEEGAAMYGEAPGGYPGGYGAPPGAYGDPYGGYGKGGYGGYPPQQW